MSCTVFIMKLQSLSYEIKCCVKPLTLNQDCSSLACAVMLTCYLVEKVKMTDAI